MIGFVFHLKCYFFISKLKWNTFQHSLTSPPTLCKQASEYGDESLFDGNGRALRTGRDGRALKEARREIHSAGLKNTSNNRLMRYCTLSLHSEFATFVLMLFKLSVAVFVF